MKLFGYVYDEDAETPSKLEEVTMVASAQNLRDVAKFLGHVADLMDKHGAKFGHEHLTDFASDFKGGPELVVSSDGGEGTPD